MIKKFLKAKYAEDGMILWSGIVAVVVILAFVVRSEASMGLALLIAGLYFGAWFVSSFNTRYGIEVILSGCGHYQKEKARLHILGTLYYNLPFGLAVLVYINLANGKVSLLCFFYAFVIYLFATALGLIVGMLAKSMISGMLICVLISLINFVKLLALEQNLRFVSPVNQIGNLKVFQWWNQLVLLVIAVTIYTWTAFRKRVIIWAGLLCIAAIVATDITVARKVDTVPADYEIYAREALEYVNEWNGRCGFGRYENIVVYKSVYYPWMSNENKVPIYVRDNTIYMNCFTESMCDLNESEIITRAVYSLLDPDMGAQNAMASLYRQWLMGEKQSVSMYLESEQTEQAGRVYNQFYALAAEVLVYEPERYGELYQMTGAYDTREEVIEVWGKSYD